MRSAPREQRTRLIRAKASGDRCRRAKGVNAKSREQKRVAREDANRPEDF